MSLSVFKYDMYPFKLSSGKTTNFIIDSKAMSDSDLRVFAHAIIDLVPPFKYVYGVPTGGTRLADILQTIRNNTIKTYTTHSTLPERFQEANGILIVDDVLTTGNSIEEFKKTFNNELPIYGAVMFARGPCPDWIKPVLYANLSIIQ